MYLSMNCRIANHKIIFNCLQKYLEKTKTTTRSEFPNGGEAIVEQILVSEEMKKSKKARL